jgi:hypothetical protein
MHYVHMYSKTTVCATCHAIYNGIDKKRLFKKNSKNIYLQDDGENIVDEINRYRMEVGPPII